LKKKNVFENCVIRKAANEDFIDNGVIKKAVTEKAVFEKSVLEKAVMEKAIQFCYCRRFLFIMHIFMLI
jgi:hypothetical protein